MGFKPELLTNQTIAVLKRMTMRKREKICINYRGGKGGQRGHQYLSLITGMVNVIFLQTLLQSHYKTVSN